MRPKAKAKKVETWKPLQGMQKTIGYLGDKKTAEDIQLENTVKGWDKKSKAIRVKLRPLRNGNDQAVQVSINKDDLGQSKGTASWSKVDGEDYFNASTARKLNKKTSSQSGLSQTSEDADIPVRDDPVAEQAKIIVENHQVIDKFCRRHATTVGRPDMEPNFNDLYAFIGRREPTMPILGLPKKATTKLGLDKNEVFIQNFTADNHPEATALISNYKAVPGVATIPKEPTARELAAISIQSAFRGHRVRKDRKQKGVTMSRLKMSEFEGKPRLIDEEDRAVTKTFDEKSLTSKQKNLLDFMRNYDYTEATPKNGDPVERSLMQTRISPETTKLLIAQSNYEPPEYPEDLPLERIFDTKQLETALAQFAKEASKVRSGLDDLSNRRKLADLLTSAQLDTGSGLTPMAGGASQGQLGLSAEDDEKKSRNLRWKDQQSKNVRQAVENIADSPVIKSSLKARDKRDESPQQYLKGSPSASGIIAKKE